MFHVVWLENIDFYYDREIITGERHKQNNKQTGRKQFAWLRERRQTRAVFGWFIANTQGKATQFSAPGKKRRLFYK